MKSKMIEELRNENKLFKKKCLYGATIFLLLSIGVLAPCISSITTLYILLCFYGIEVITTVGCYKYLTINYEINIEKQIKKIERQDIFKDTKNIKNESEVNIEDIEYEDIYEVNSEILSPSYMIDSDRKIDDKRRVNVRRRIKNKTNNW